MECKPVFEIFDKDFYGVVPDEGSDVDGYVAAEKLLGLC